MSKAELAKQIRTGQHIPDILDCLAQLSNDEVPTPPKLARAMLDVLKGPGCSFETTGRSA